MKDVRKYAIAEERDTVWGGKTEKRMEESVGELETGAGEGGHNQMVMWRLHCSL